MSLYTMKLSDSVDTMEFNLLEVPIQDKDIEGTVDNVVLSGDIYTDFLWLKKRFTHKWSILCKDDYERLRGFYTRQFSNAEVPIYQLLDAPSPVEEPAGSGEYIQITTTDSTAKLASVEMLGNAEQTTYSGKNLFDGANPFGVTGYNQKTISLPAGKYTITASAITTNGTDAMSFFNFYNSDNQSVGGGQLSHSTKKLGVTLSADATSVYIYAQNNYSASVGKTTTFTNLMIESGTTATAYEPYVGGTSAPNPAFPQPISVVTGENVVKIEGKNLFELTASTRTDAGVVFTKTTDTITAVGTSTRGTYAEALSIYDNFSGLGNYPSYATTTATNSFQLPAGTYTFSANITNTGNTTGGLNIGVGTLGARVSTSTKLEKTAGQSGTASATISVAEGQYVLLSVWYEGTANTPNVNLSINQVQLEKGSPASSFEPYQAQEFEVNLGKNLLDPSATIQGVWNNASNTTTCTFFTPIYTGESFTISNKDTATWRFSAGLTTNPTNNPAGTGSQISAWQTGASYTITAQSDGYLWVQLRKNANTAITPSDIPADVFMVERGSSATSFAPYFTPIELAKIGNYQDRIYKEDSKWYIEKKVGKVVLDGSESWTTASTNISGRVRTRTTVIANLVKKPASGNILGDAISSHFVIATSGRNWEGDQSFCIETNGNMSFYADGTQTQSVSNWTTWLTSHPTTVYYALATPTTTEITNEALIAQLEALGASSLYLGVNNIGTETQNAMPTLALTYFPYYPHEIVSPKAVRMELTDGGIINACECRENVQITLRETIQ